MCHGQARRYIGDGNNPTFNDRNPYFMGPYKPLRTWFDFPIPYYMEMMGVDRPDCTYESDLGFLGVNCSESQSHQPLSTNLLPRPGPTGSLGP